MKKYVKCVCGYYAKLDSKNKKEETEDDDATLDCWYECEECQFIFCRTYTQRSLERNSNCYTSIYENVKDRIQDEKHKRERWVKTHCEECNCLLEPTDKEVCYDCEYSMKVDTGYE